MLPLVSVVMPAYNSEKYIGKAIESILNQTYKWFELIVVEDGSGDNTLQVINEYDDARIKLIKNECNRGIAYSTNRGIACAEGKYIALMDDDDIAVSERLALQVNFLEKHPDIDILGGRSNDIDDSGYLIREGGIPRNNPRYIRAVLLFKCMNFRNGTTMMRKEFIDKNALCYEENSYGMQDFKFFIESSKKGNISTISDLLLYYRVHKENETTRQKKDFEEERRRTYARFQRESLREEGYRLDEEKLSTVNRLLAEFDGGCNNRYDLQILYATFEEIIKQARIMGLDYCKELEHYCKLILAEQVRQLISF